MWSKLNCDHNQEKELVDADDLIDRIRYANNWQDVKCPEWVLQLIKAVPKE